MNLLEKQPSTVYFEDVRFPWVTLYIASHWVSLEGNIDISLPPQHTRLHNTLISEVAQPISPTAAILSRYNFKECYICLFWGQQHPPPSPSGPGPPHSRDFLITHRRTTLGMTPVEELSAHHRDLRQTSRFRWDSNPQSLQASGHWDRQCYNYTS